MNKIKTFLIRLLGGVTTADAAMDYAVGYENGHNDCLAIVLQKMDNWKYCRIRDKDYGKTS